MLVVRGKRWCRVPSKLKACGGRPPLAAYVYKTVFFGGGDNPCWCVFLWRDLSLHLPVMPSHTVSPWLEIIRYDQRLLPDHTRSALKFYAYNLSTNSAIEVYHQGNTLFLLKSQIFFSEISGDEIIAVNKMQNIISSAEGPEDLHQQGLAALLSLYSSPHLVPGTGHAQQQHHHQQSFVQIKFAIPGDIAFSNNFLCLMAIQQDPVHGLVALEPFHGSLWENMTDHVPSFILTGHKGTVYAPDARIRQMRKLFDSRHDMRLGIAILAPFLHATRQLAREAFQPKASLQKTPYREVAKKIDPHKQQVCRAEKARPMMFRQNVYTYVEVFGHMVSVAQSQRQLCRNKVEYQKASSILCGAVQLFGPQNSVANAGMIDMFYTMLVYVATVCCLGTNLYRADLLGEDINNL